jgi:hypothetical protein
VTGTTEETAMKKKIAIRKVGSVKLTLLCRVPYSLFRF